MLYMATTRPILIDIGQGMSLMIGQPLIASWKTDERPQNAKRGTFGFNAETNSLEYSDGSSWYSASLRGES